MPAAMQRGKPVRIALIGLSLTILLTAAIGWSTRQIDRSRDREQTLHILQALLGNLAQLDESLTRATRMAAMSGEEDWIARYETLQPQIDTTLHRITTLATFDGGPELVRRLETANSRMEAAEAEALELVRDGQRDLALQRISNETYNSLKADFIAARSELASAAGTQFKSASRGADRTIWLGSIFNALFILGLLVTWVAVYRRLVRYVRERDDAEAALLESERRLNVLIDNVPGVVYRMHRASGWRQDFMSSGMHELTGYSADTFVRGEIVLRDLIDPGDRSRVREVIRSAIGRGEPFAVQYRIMTADSGHRWVLERGQAVVDGDGQVSGLEGLLTDVTSLRGAAEREVAMARERAARESAEAGEQTAELERLRLASVLDVLPGAVFLVDAEGRLIMTNAAASRIWGGDLPATNRPDEYERYTAWWPQTGERVQGDEWGLARAVNGEDVDGQEVEIETFDGRRRTILNSARPIRDSSGRQVGAVALNIDITELKEAERELRSSEERYRIVSSITSDAFWELDPETHDIEWNATFEQAFGGAAADLDTWSERIHPDDRARVVATFDEAIESRSPHWSEEYRFRREDGTWAWVFDRAALRYDAAGEPLRIFGAMMDRTKEKEAEQELHAAREKAESASRAKSRMLSRTSHELRTPLNSILGFAQLLEMDLAVERNRDNVQQILRAGRHLMALVDDVLDITGAESGRIAVRPEPVDLREAIAEALSLMTPHAMERSIELPSDLTPVCEVQVLADTQRLRQVLLHLIANAVAYNREGGRVEIRCDAPTSGRARLEIRDTGPGIPEEMLGRLFTPFERLGAERSDTAGVGLGLPLARSLVDAMQGRIGVHSAPGQGSTFWVELPLADADAQTAAAGGDLPAVADEQDGVVLYIEDMAANVRLMTRIFERRRPGMELITAERGGDGLELARSRRPAVILLDLDLPDLSGEEVLERLRRDQQTHDIPVVVISGDASPATIERLRDMGALEYITKPFDIAHLMEVLDQALRLRAS